MGTLCKLLDLIIFVVNEPSYAMYSHLTFPDFILLHFFFDFFTFPKTTEIAQHLRLHYAVPLCLFI